MKSSNTSLNMITKPRYFVSLKIVVINGELFNNFMMIVTIMMACKHGITFYHTYHYYQIYVWIGINLAENMSKIILLYKYYVPS